MTSIRTYIDLVEGLEENYVGSSYQNDNPVRKKTFGKKGTALPVRPLSPEDEQAIVHARKYDSAEAYARDNNLFHWTNTDPDHVKHRGETEHQRLMARWNNWKQQGHI